GALLALPLVLTSLVLMLLVRGADRLFPHVSQTAERDLARRGAWPWAPLAALPVLLAAGTPLYGLVAKIVEDRMLRPGTPSPFLTLFDRVPGAVGHRLLFTAAGL